MNHSVKIPSPWLIMIPKCSMKWIKTYTKNDWADIPLMNNWSIHSGLQVEGIICTPPSISSSPRSSMLTTLPFPAEHDLASLDICGLVFTWSHILMPVISPVKLCSCTNSPATNAWSCPNISLAPLLMKIPARVKFEFRLKYQLYWE